MIIDHSQQQQQQVQEQEVEIDLSTTMEFPHLKADQEHNVLFMTTLQAPDFTPEELEGEEGGGEDDKGKKKKKKKERAGLDIVCVIDKSGSMSGAKIDLVRRTLDFMVDQLKKKDRISLVAFDSSVATQLPLTRLDTTERVRSAKSAIASLQAGSMTNLSGGLFEGYNVLRKRTDFNEVSAILLFTDGHANEGVTSTDGIIAGINNICKDMENVPTLYTFGFGEDHNASMLTSIADAGHGMYYYVEDEEAIPGAFGDALGGLISVVAQNIKMCVEIVDKDSRIVKVLSTLRDAKLDNTGKSLIAQLGDMYSEEKKDIIVSIQLPRCTPTDSVDIARVTLEYFSTIDNNFYNQTAIARVSRPPEAPQDMVPDFELDKQRNRIISTDALVQARNCGETGDLATARQKINEAIARIEKSVSSNDTFCQSLIVDLRDCLESLVDRRSYTSVGSKKMNTYWASNAYQRSTGYDKSASNQAYQSKARMATKARFMGLL